MKNDALNLTPNLKPEDTSTSPVADSDTNPSSPRASRPISYADEKKAWSADSTPTDGGERRSNFKDFEAGHINVRRAEDEFQQLNKELGAELRHSLSINLTRSRRGRDLEKGDLVGIGDEPFDLESTLRGDREAAEEAGLKFKKIGVLWRDLNVRGIGGTKHFVKTFPTSFVTFFNPFGVFSRLLPLGGRGKEVDILKGFRGVVKPGEMILVLGRPGSGCTSFLKVISNQRTGYSNISGDVFYGPFDHRTFSKRYRGEAVYNAEDESQSMHPTLTVGQTLEFALNTKVPSNRPAGLSRYHFKERVVRVLLKMFNIEHTRNTMVGGPYVRGISGGERKRVSIAEMMITNASVCAWDCPTRGLDSSTAVDYVRSIRILCDIHKISTIVTAYQVSETIYKEFDKVMVIDQGRQVYFGPANEARAYFESLGFLPKLRQTTADYLTACTDPYEREYNPGIPAEFAPRTAEQLADRFDQSAYSSRLDSELQSYQDTMGDKESHQDFLTAIKQSKRRTSSRNVYSIPLYLQVWALMKRQSILKWQDKFSLYVSWSTCLLIAMLLSTLWVNSPETSAGAFTRGGVIFISFLFNGFQAFGELVGTMVGRPIINKHRAYAFYRPSALWIAQIGVDLAFQTPVIFVFCIMVYFSTGLVREAAAFFSFVLTILTGYLCMTLVFRTIGILSPDFDVAIRSASIMISLLVLTSGYPIQYDDQPVWLRWLFWVNPTGLGFSSLMINEFRRLNLRCTDESLIPHGPGYNDLAYQVCTLLGSRPGDSIVRGVDYLREHFGYRPEDQWRNWGLIGVLIAAFLIANLLLGESLNWGAGGRSITPYVKETKELRELNEDLQRRKEDRSNTRENVAANIHLTSQSILTWEAVNYDVPTPSGHKRILNNVYGYVRPGELTALMGASGAGKTTLLDVLASRKNVGIVGGDILIDGEQPGLAFQRSTAYAEQLDIHEPALTVREALRFSADLRQPFNTPQAEKYSYVEEIISLLELEDVADAIIGTAEAGLPPYQRKLLTIGVELASKPELLLFLDEPTSGLDSQSAWNIARFLRKLTAAGQAVLCTIHQPNSALFHQFDRLLLLQRGGECVYFGPLGEDAAAVREYFRSKGAECPANANVAEWMLDAIGAGLNTRLGDRDWGEVWTQSAEFSRAKTEIIRLKSQSLGQSIQTGQREYATPLLHQLKHVSWRQSLSIWRTPNYGFTRLINHISHALASGLAFIGLGTSRASLQNRLFVIFQICVLPALVIAQVEPKFALARALSHREQAAKAYRSLPWALAMAIAEIPYSFLCAAVFYILIHYIPALHDEPDRAGYLFLAILAVENFSVYLGQMIAAMTPNPKIAALFNPPVIITFALFSGVAVPRPQIPAFWRSWLFEIDPMSRLVGGAIVTELHNTPVECRAEELQRFQAPSGMDCMAYMRDFFDAGGAGYLAGDGNRTRDCEYCAFRVGDEFYQPLGYSWDHRWRDLGILWCYVFSTVAIVLVATRYINFNRR